MFTTWTLAITETITFDCADPRAFFPVFELRRGRIWRRVENYGCFSAEPPHFSLWKPPWLIYLLAAWLAGSVGVGEIVDDVEINVCFLLTRKSWSWVEWTAVLAWFRPRVECSVEEELPASLPHQDWHCHLIDKGYNSITQLVPSHWDSLCSITIVTPTSPTTNHLHNLSELSP